MSRPANNFVLMLSFALLCGCAHVPDTRSVRHRQAEEWAIQGEQAYLRGNLEQSHRDYERALQINASIENARGIASDTLSLAQIHLERGEYEQAGARLQTILDDKGHLFASADKADATARSAQLALLMKQPERAAQLAEKAGSLCAETDCSLRAAILNLRAQAALALGKDTEAADMARNAGDAAGKLKQPVELANAQRLQAEILLHGKAAADAVPLLEQVLVLDKQKGLARKIAEDLHLMAEAKDMQGLGAEAESFRSRERAVRAALGEKGR